MGQVPSSGICPKDQFKSTFHEGSTTTVYCVPSDSSTRPSSPKTTTAPARKTPVAAPSPSPSPSPDPPPPAPSSSTGNGGNNGEDNNNDGGSGTGAGRSTPSTPVSTGASSSSSTSASSSSSMPTAIRSSSGFSTMTIPSTSNTADPSASPSASATGITSSSGQANALSSHSQQTFVVPLAAVLGAAALIAVALFLVIRRRRRSRRTGGSAGLARLPDGVTPFDNSHPSSTALIADLSDKQIATRRNEARERSIAAAGVVDEKQREAEEDPEREPMSPVHHQDSGWRASEMVEETSRRSAQRQEVPPEYTPS